MYNHGPIALLTKRKEKKKCQCSFYTSMQWLLTNESSPCPNGHGGQRWLSTYFHRWANVDETYLMHFCYQLLYTLLWYLKNILQKLLQTWGLDTSLDTSMTCMGNNEIKPPIYGNFVKKKKCIRTNGKIENEFIYVY